MHNERVNHHHFLRVNESCEGRVCFHAHEFEIDRINLAPAVFERAKGAFNNDLEDPFFCRRKFGLMCRTDIAFAAEEGVHENADQSRGDAHENETLQGVRPRDALAREWLD